MGYSINYFFQWKESEKKKKERKKCVYVWLSSLSLFRQKKVHLVTRHNNNNN